MSGKVEKLSHGAGQKVPANQETPRRDSSGQQVDLEDPRGKEREAVRGGTAEGKSVVGKGPGGLVIWKA